MDDLRFCHANGRVVGATWPLPADPSAYEHPGFTGVVGCNNLRCASCGEVVRQQPGLGEEGDGLDPERLFAADDWGAAPGLRPFSEGRLYSCRCTAWVETSCHQVEDPDPELTAPDLPWECAGHPLAMLPIEVDGFRIDGSTDFAELFDRVVGRWAPPASLGVERDLPIGWLAKVYAWLDGLPQGTALAEAIAAGIDSDDEWHRGSALFFFDRFPRAPGFERAVDLFEADGGAVAERAFPAPYSSSDSLQRTPLAVLASRAASIADEPDDLDRRTLDALRVYAIRGDGPLDPAILVALAHGDGERLARGAIDLVSADPANLGRVLDALASTGRDELVVVAGVALAGWDDVDHDALLLWAQRPPHTYEAYSAVIIRAVEAQFE